MKTINSLNKQGLNSLNKQLLEKVKNYDPDTLNAWADDVIRKIGEGETIENSIELKVPPNKCVFVAFNESDFHWDDI